MRKLPKKSKRPQTLADHGERLKRLHRHPFIIPVVTFFVLFFLTAVGFVATGGTTIGPSDSHMVQLYVDGNQQVLPSRAETVGDFLKKSNISVGPNDVVEPVVATPINEDNFSVNVYRAKSVTIIDQGGGDHKPSTVTTDSAQQTPESIAKAAGYTVLPEDKVTIKSSDEALQQGIINQQVVIERSVPISIYLYDNQVPTRTTAKTVAQALADKGIKFRKSDSVLPGLNAAVTPGMQIYLTAKGEQILTETQEVPNNSQTVNDPLTDIGIKTVRQPGSPGKKVVTFQLVKQTDGSIQKKVLQEIVTLQPTDEVVVKGTKLKPMPIGGDKGAILTAAGVPSDQQFYADFVIARESGWNLTAHNAGGCLGLGQACPGSKLTNACPNWSTDAICQIQFFDRYSKRYGSWSGAYNFWIANHWW